jgi:hypothetical protein
MLDANFKARWVAALRSGNYEQGQSVLHQVNNGEEQFCCLGVACAISPEVVTEIVDDRTDNRVLYAYTDTTSSNWNKHTGSLPQKMLDVFNFPGSADNAAGSVYVPDNAGSVYIPEIDASLVDLNDSDDHLSFSQIADIIDYFL